MGMAIRNSEAHRSTRVTRDQRRRPWPGSPTRACAPCRSRWAARHGGDGACDICHAIARGAVFVLLDRAPSDRADLIERASAAISVVCSSERSSPARAYVGLAAALRARLAEASNLSAAERQFWRNGWTGSPTDPEDATRPFRLPNAAPPTD